MPGFVGVPELLLLGVVLLLLFGPKRLPEIGRSRGRGVREFKESVTNDAPKKADAATEPTPAVASTDVVAARQRDEAP